MLRSPSMARFCRLLAACVLACAGARVSPAVIHLDSGDPTVDTTTPGDNSGWQYEGLFGSYLGTPIAPYYFLTAKHIGQASTTFIFHGETFNVVTGYSDPDTDLQIWQVDHPFATYAPVYQPGDPQNSQPTEPGQELRVFGRGTQRGTEIDLGGTLRGWNWGGSDGVERWGRNIVASVLPSGVQDDWNFLQASFDSPGVVDEAHLSVGDSGGGTFILQNGLWRLAGINYGVDDLFTGADGSGSFAAAVFDARGFYTQNDDGTFSLITGLAEVPTSFYCTEVAERIQWIEDTVGSMNVASLPAESFDQWAHAYFTPDQLSDDTVSGPGADPDGDGVSNLLEFAFNLDPTFSDPVVMTADTGLRGLPLVRLEQVADSDRRLTVEFVRRTAGSGSGVTYATQFTSDLNAAWQTGGTESVTAINERWERVKVTDTASVGGAVQARFARVLVSQDPPAPPSAVARAGGGPVKAASQKGSSGR